MPVSRHTLQNILKDDIIVYKDDELVVKINDPYLGTLITECGQSILYELVAGLAQLNKPKCAPPVKKPKNTQSSKAKNAPPAKRAKTVAPASKAKDPPRPRKGKNQKEYPKFYWRLKLPLSLQQCTSRL